MIFDHCKKQFIYKETKLEGINITLTFLAKCFFNEKHLRTFANAHKSICEKCLLCLVFLQRFVDSKYAISCLLDELQLSLSRKLELHTIKMHFHKSNPINLIIFIKRFPQNWSLRHLTLSNACSYLQTISCNISKFYKVYKEVFIHNKQKKTN
jgi:hypothetical protein